MVTLNRTWLFSVCFYNEILKIYSDNINVIINILSLKNINNNHNKIYSDDNAKDLSNTYTFLNILTLVQLEIRYCMVNNYLIIND